MADLQAIKGGNVPTRVGVNRCHIPSSARRKQCPHACGGEPLRDELTRVTVEMSPRVWG